MTKQALLIVDVQPRFSPSPVLVENIKKLLPFMPSAATVQHHDEAKVPFLAQINWRANSEDACMFNADRVFIKYGYSPPPDAITYLRELQVERVLVCGLQTEACVLAAGFDLFDAGLFPTLIADLTAGGRNDPSGEIGIGLWKRHIGKVVELHTVFLPT